MQPSPVYRRTLTGACRPRRGLLGRVVMVVEVKVESLDPWPRRPPMPPLATKKDGDRYRADCLAYETTRHERKVLGTWYEWRDARLSDFALSASVSPALSFSHPAT